MKRGSLMLRFVLSRPITEKLDLLLAFHCDSTPTTIYDSASSKYLPFCSLKTVSYLPGELTGEIPNYEYYSGDDVCVKEKGRWFLF